MQRRAFIISALGAFSVPGSILAQSNSLQASFEALDDQSRQAAQEQLQMAGFYNGSIDGRYGSATQSALIDAAQFIEENSYGRVRFDVSSSADARRYVALLAAGELGKYLWGEGDEFDG